MKVEEQIEKIDETIERLKKEIEICFRSQCNFVIGHILQTQIEILELKRFVLIELNKIGTLIQYG